MMALVKEEAKRYCMAREKMQGFGMGMPLWLPQVCGMEEFNKKFKCCDEEPCECKKEEMGCCKDVRAKHFEAVKKAMENPDPFTKSILDCPCVPAYIKECPFTLAFFKDQVIKQHAKQALKAYCFMKQVGGCCKCGECCEKECPCDPACHCSPCCECHK